MTILEKIANGILNVLFPTLCVGCGREGQYLCERCEGFVSEAAFICPVCEQSSFAGERHTLCKSRYGLDGLVGMWEYEGVIKNLLHYTKYHGVAHAIGETIQRAFGVMTKDKDRFSPLLSFLFSQSTRITYVPMYRKKERRRGFNQAAVFAQAIGAIAGREVVCTLEKIRDTKPQIDLKKEERLQNVKDSFASSFTPNLGKMERLVLVDDVWTTGATMKECCKVLKRSGAKEVWGFTLARTV